MARRRRRKAVKKKKVKRKKEFKAMNTVLWTIVIIVVIVAIGILLMQSVNIPGINGVVNGETVTPTGEKIIEGGGSCTSNSGCFAVKCTDESAWTCVNTNKYIDKLLECGSQNIDIVRNITYCACIQEICAVP